MDFNRLLLQHFLFPFKPQVRQYLNIVLPKVVLEQLAVISSIGVVFLFVESLSVKRFESKSIELGRTDAEVRTQ